MADEENKQLEAFRGAKQRYADAVRESNPEEAAAVEAMDEAQFALYMHANDERFGAIPLVKFLESTGVDAMDVLNGLYRPGTDDAYSNYLDYQLNAPDVGPVNQQALEQKYAVGKSAYSSDLPEGALRSFAQEGTLGWSDEMLAWARMNAAKSGGNTEGMTDEELYKLFLDDERKRYERFKVDDPVASDVAGVAGSFAPMMLLPTGEGGTVLQRLGAGAFTGGVSSGLYAAGTAENDEDRLAAGFGAAAPGAIVNAPFAVGGRLVNPTFVDPEAQAASKELAKRFKINALTAGQKFGDTQLKLTEAGAGAAFDKKLAKQREQYMQALWREAGLDTVYEYDALGNVRLNKKGEPIKRKALDAKQETLVAAHDTLSKEADALESRNKAYLPPIAGDIDRIYQNYVAAPDIGPIKTALRDAREVILRAAATGSGTIDGTEYRRLRSALAKASANAQPTDAEALRDMRQQLDTAMESWIGANNSKDLGKFQETRKRWNALYTIESAAAFDPDATRLGFVSPDALKKAVLARDPAAIAPVMQTGKGPAESVNRFIKLADVAEEVGLGVVPTKAPPKTRAAQLKELAREAALPGLFGAAGAGAAYSATGNPLIAATVAPMAATVGYGVDQLGKIAKSKVAMNPVSQAYLSMPNLAREWMDPLVSKTLMSNAPERGDAAADIFNLKEVLDTRYKPEEQK